ncbi:MAG: hypothetical protein ACI8P3_000834 [Saprospiraceae bacterium]|jgi:hypothetical protein
MNIQLIPHKEIDKTKWNSCVHYATNGNIFGYKWYLDTVAKEWDGLVEGDYESVMPLFITEKQELLEQPKLLREAGIYSIHLLSQKRTMAFLEAIPGQYSDVLLQLNEGIQLAEDSDYEVTQLKNYQLVLLDAYETIVDKYAPSLRSQRKSPDRKQMLPSSNVKPEKIAQLFKDNSPATIENEMSFHTYQRIMYNALHRGWGATFGVTDLDKHLLSAAFFIYGQGRVMQLVTATSPKGKTLGAYEYLMDNFMQSHAGRPMVLDFNTPNEDPERFGAKANYFLRLEKGSKITQSIAKKSWKFW